MSINHLPEAEQERIITSLPFVGGLRIEFSREWPAAGVDQGRPGHFTQVLVLRELTERIGAAWVATHLPVDHADPFAALMAAAADRRSDDLDAAARREREWAAEKARFQHDIGLAALVSGTDEPAGGPE